MTRLSQPPNADSHAQCNELGTARADWLGGEKPDWYQACSLQNKPVTGSNKDMPSLSSNVLAYSTNKRSDNTRHTVLVSYLYAVTSFPLITSWLRQSGLDFDIIHEGLEVNVVAKIIMSYTRIKWPSSLCGTISFFSSQTSLYSVRGEQRLL